MILRRPVSPRSRPDPDRPAAVRRGRKEVDRVGVGRVPGVDAPQHRVEIGLERRRRGIEEEERMMTVMGGRRRVEEGCCEGLVEKEQVQEQFD